jgi:hypothetical protein
MKRILFILVLFGIVLNTFGQSIGEYDEVIVNDELTVRDSTLIEIIEAQTSGTSLDGQNAVYKNGNFFELGTNPLIKNTDIPGGLYNLNIGTTGNKINTLTLNGQNLTINSDNSIVLTASGISCEWDGSLLVCGTDTIATLADVRTEIAASLPLLAFNFDYTFSSSTTDSRPGAGLFRLNNAVLASVTRIYVDYFDNENISQSVFLSAPDTGSYIALLTDANNYALYQLTGALTDAGNYFKYAVTYKGHNGVISGATTLDFDLSNNVGGVGGGGFSGNRLDTLGINDSIWIVNAWLDGVQETSKFQVDTLEANVHIVGQGASKDTLTGAIDLKTAVEAEQFDYIEFDTSHQAYDQGKLYYCKHDKVLSFYNDITGFEHNLGYEHVIRFFNNTGSTLTDGTIVRSTGAKVNSTITFFGDLAGIGSIDSLQGVAMVMADVPDQSFGIATLMGQVNGLNTSMYSDNQLIYMSHAGTYDTINPDPPLFSKLVGRVVYADADSGAIYFYGFAETEYNPNPDVSLSFTRQTETITNPGQNTPALITNATNNIYTVDYNKGFTVTGDTVQADQAGVYAISCSYAFQGDAATGDDWRIGIFVNGVEQFSVLRTSSSSNKGVVALSKITQLLPTDWVSLRVENTTNGTRSSIFTDGVINIEFLGLP